MTAFAVSREELPDRIVIRVVGEVDLATAGGLLGAMAPDSGRPFVVDLREVTFMDSSGLNALVQAASAGAVVTVTNPSINVRRAFEVVGLDHFFATEA